MNSYLVSVACKHLAEKLIQRYEWSFPDSETAFQDADNKYNVLVGDAQRNGWTEIKMYRTNGGPVLLREFQCTNVDYVIYPELIGKKLKKTHMIVNINNSGKYKLIDLKPTKEIA